MNMFRVVFCNRDTRKELTAYVVAYGVDDAQEIVLRAYNGTIIISATLWPFDLVVMS